MSTRDELMVRMLKLFPKRLIKESFKVSGKDFSLEEITPQISDDRIYEFTRNNLDFTRQHVYILGHNMKTFAGLPETILTENTIKNTFDDAVEYYDYYDVSYQVFLQQPFKQTKLAFKWPIRTIVKKDFVIVHFTILEKDVKSYFADQNILTTRKSIDENEIITLISEGLSKFGTLEACDLNKGIKELWKRDIVDAVEVQYLKDKSTSKETMHEEYTFKQQYPELYENAIQNPLMKVLFKFIVNNGEYCDHFTIEPTLGKINFPAFSKEKEDNQNVIRKILEFN